MNDLSERRDPRFQVLVNAEEQYGLHPESLPIPAAWRATGVAGTEEHCIAWADGNWTDMRPLGLRADLGDEQ